MHTSRIHPNTFHYIGLFSPAIMPIENDISPVYDDFEETLKHQMENDFGLYWIAIGETDFLYNQVEEYRYLLDDMGMPYEHLETEGGHTWKNWREYLTLFVPRLFK